MEPIADNCMDDLEKQIIEEELSYQFYDKAVNTVEFIGPQKQFKEMMWEEFNHVRLLRDKYAELGGNKQIVYNAEQHGGLAMSSKELDTEAALDIGIKEEIESIARYDALSRKYKDHKLSDLFSSLLNDERTHLSNWGTAQIEYISARSKPFGKSKRYQTYRFTPTDLHVIDEAVKYWGKYYANILNMVKSLCSIGYRDVMLSIVRDENEHIKLLEDEYFRLRGFKPDRYEALTDTQSGYANNTDIFNIEQIIDEDKGCFIQLYDWVRRCTNEQLRETLWNIMEDKYAHLKLWAKID